MELRVFSIRDEKVGAYMQPFFSPTVGSAIRAISDVVNDVQSQFSKHPSDYVLFEIGVYDDISGLIKSLESPKSIGVLLEYKNQ